MFKVHHLLRNGERLRSLVVDHMGQFLKEDESTLPFYFTEHKEMPVQMQIRHDNHFKEAIFEYSD